MGQICAVHLCIVHSMRGDVTTAGMVCDVRCFQTTGAFHNPFFRQDVYSSTAGAQHSTAASCSLPACLERFILEPDAPFHSSANTHACRIYFPPPLRLAKGATKPGIMRHTCTRSHAHNIKHPCFRQMTNSYIPLSTSAPHSESRPS